MLLLCLFYFNTLYCVSHQNIYYWSVGLEDLLNPNFSCKIYSGIRQQFWCNILKLLFYSNIYVQNYILILGNECQPTVERIIVLLNAFKNWKKELENLKNADQVLGEQVDDEPVPDLSLLHQDVQRSVGEFVLGIALETKHFF